MATTVLTFRKKFTKVHSRIDGGISTNDITLDDSVVKQGSLLPNWRELSKAGLDCTTLYTLEAIHRNSSAVTIKGSVVIGGVTKHESIRNPLYYPPDSWSDLTNTVAEATSAASQQFFKRLRASQREFAGPTFVAELADTIRMLKRPASSLRDFTISWAERHRSLRRKPLKGSELRKALAGAYLEWRFGVAPLLSDTADAARAIAAATEKIRRTSVSAHSNRTVTTKTGATSYSPGGYFPPADIEYYNDDVVDVRIKALLRAEVNQPPKDHFLALKETMGFNFSEFVPALWEMIPYSFIVDYFTNVGDILSAYTTSTAGLQWYSRSTKTVSSAVVRGTTRELLTPPYHYPSQSMGEVKSKRVRFSRARAITYPVLTFNIPKIGQVANLAGLWAALKK